MTSDDLPTSDPPLSADDLEAAYPEYANQIAHVETRPPRNPETVPVEDVLRLSLARRFPYEDLYTHQARGLNHLANGEDICVTTTTSSGKTLIYALHIAEQVKATEETTALLIYPTKALARDQQEELAQLYADLNLDLDIGVYDGDVGQDEKRRVRNESDIIITNFQGLNYYLPHHEKWSDFFSALDTVVIDEAHMFTGIEGMHVAWITRRLLRLVTREYNADPQVVLTSATIGNPADHAKNLTGRDVTVVSEDGSPHGRRDIVFWNPPAYEDPESETLQRRSSHRESSAVLAHLVANDVQSLLFAPSRKLTELCAQWTEETLEASYDPYDVTVEPYNAGHQKAERRRVETNLKRGALDGVVSTTALEVGIDIGGIDAVVMDGYPGRRTSFWQQLGRAGRGVRESLAVLVARNDSIDQYILNHPEYLFEASVENAVLDLTNRQVLKQHLKAAANEMPLTTADADLFGPEFKAAVTELKSANAISGSLTSGVSHRGWGRPEADINLYATSETQFEVLIAEDGETTSLPDVDATRAYRDFHPGAIYLHRGQQYEVVDFTATAEERQVVLEPTTADYYTQSSRDVEITEVTKQTGLPLGNGLRVCRGTATIQESYPTYSKVYLNQSRRETGIPTGLTHGVSVETDVMWIELDTETERWVSQEADHGGLLGALHAAEHALIKMAPTVLTVDSNDLGGLSTLQHPATDGATVFIYEGVSGGVGFTKTLFQSLSRLAGYTAEMLAECDCGSEAGCPACTMDSMCGDNNEPLDAHGAYALVDQLAGPT